MTSSDDQFTAADRAVTQAAGKIERAIEDLLAATTSLEHVAPDYVIERLAAKLIARNPQALDWLNRRPNEGALRLANALMDWRDIWEDR